MLASKPLVFSTTVTSLFVHGGDHSRENQNSLWAPLIILEEFKNSNFRIWVGELRRGKQTSRIEVLKRRIHSRAKPWFLYTPLAVIFVIFITHL